MKEGEGGWKEAATPYVLEDQSLKGIIKVRAVDKAGNERIAEYGVKEPFPYLIIIVILVAGGIIWWTIRKLKMKS